MKRWGKRFIGVFITFAMLCFCSVAMAEYDETTRVLSFVQGKWYDAEDNVVLNFQGNTVNGCPVIKAYHTAGGGGDFSTNLRILEAGGYRDIRLSCDGLSINGDYSKNYHAHIVLNYDGRDASKGILLSPTKTPRYYETVGGIGIDMPAKFVLDHYGKPNKIKKDKGGVQEWYYKKLGLMVSMEHNVVHRIKIFKGGDRRFDRSGLGCNNTLSEFKNAYGFNRMPIVPQSEYSTGGAFSVGYGEYLWFDDYPNSIELNTYWN